MRQLLPGSLALHGIKLIHHHLFIHGTQKADHF